MAETTPPTPPTIEEQMATLTAALELQQKISSEQAKTIAALKGAVMAEKTEPKKKPVIPQKNVKVNGKEYKFRLAHFYFDNTIILAEDAALDNDLLKKIVAVEGQNVLIEQV